MSLEPLWKLQLKSSVLLYTLCRRVKAHADAGAASTIPTSSPSPQTSGSRATGNSDGREGGAVRQALCSTMATELADFYRLMAVLEVHASQPIPTPGACRKCLTLGYSLLNTSRMTPELNMLHEQLISASICGVVVSCTTTHGHELVVNNCISCLFFLLAGRRLGCSRALLDPEAPCGLAGGAPSTHAPACPVGRQHARPWGRCSSGCPVRSCTGKSSGARDDYAISWLKGAYIGGGAMNCAVLPPYLYYITKCVNLR
jgi:hypothetical protein